MHILLILFFGQCVFAVAVVVVLRKSLDKELMMAALEQFASCRMSSEIKEISVRSASVIHDDVKGHLESIRKHKMPQANLNFQKDASLKGGIVIAMGDLLLDFSLSSRLQDFWS